MIIKLNEIKKFKNKKAPFVRNSKKTEKHLLSAAAFVPGAGVEPKK